MPACTNAQTTKDLMSALVMKVFILTKIIQLAKVCFKFYISGLSFHL